MNSSKTYRYGYDETEFGEISFRTENTQHSPVCIRIKNGRYKFSTDDGDDAGDEKLLEQFDGAAAAAAAARSLEDLVVEVGKAKTVTSVAFKFVHDLGV